MKKLFLLLPAALLLFLCACGGSSEQKADFEPSELAKALYDSSCFTDLLSEVDSATALEMYGIDADTVESCAVYFGTGATAEEIAVVKCTGNDEADKAEAAFNARVESQISAYENYVPSEVPKLENAIVRRSGVYAVYVTANDEPGAREIIDQYMN